MSSVPRDTCGLSVKGTNESSAPGMTQCNTFPQKRHSFSPRRESERPDTEPPDPPPLTQTSVGPPESTEKDSTGIPKTRWPYRGADTLDGKPLLSFVVLSRHREGPEIVCAGVRGSFSGFKMMPEINVKDSFGQLKQRCVLCFEWRFAWGIARLGKDWGMTIESKEYQWLDA